MRKKKQYILANHYPSRTPERIGKKKSAKTIVVSKMAMLKEHKKLIPMLNKVNKKEAKEQKREMKKYK